MYSLVPVDGPGEWTPPRVPPAGVLPRRRFLELTIAGVTFAFGVGSGEVWAGVGSTVNYTPRQIRVVSGPMRHRNLAEALTAPVTHERMDAFGLTVMLLNVVMAIIGVAVATVSLVTAMVTAMALIMLGGSGGGPIGQAVAAVAVALLALALALQAGFAALAERVRNDNTTTLVVVNRFRGSSVFGKVPALEHGEPLGPYEQDLDSWGAGPIGFRALGRAFSRGEEDHALVFAARGRVKGKVTLVVSRKGQRTEIEVSLDNPLGGDQARSNHSIQVADRSVCSAKAQLFTAEGDTRRDVYVVVVEKPKIAPANLAAAPQRAVSDASLPVRELRMGLRVVNGDQRGEFLIDLTDLDPSGGGGAGSGFSRRKQFAESTLQALRTNLGSQLSDQTLTDADKALTAFGVGVDVAGGYLAALDFVPEVWLVGKAVAEATKKVTDAMGGITKALAGTLGDVLNIAGMVSAAASVTYSIVNMTQDANSTAVIIVNMVKGSTVRVKSLFFTQGGLTADTPDAELRRSRAGCTERISDVLLLRMGSRAAGRIHGELKLPNGTVDDFTIDFSNPLGPDQSRSDWSVTPSRRGPVAFSGALQPPTDEKGQKNRRDVFVLAIEPARELQMTGAIGIRPLESGKQLVTVDAICAFPKEGRFFFFRKGQYLAFGKDAKAPEPGYPVRIHGGFDTMLQIPDSPDAAVTWNDDRVYFFKGNQYWRYRIGSPGGAGARKTDDGYPKPISVGWGKGFFQRVDAALNWGDGTLFLFSGDQVTRWDIASDREVSGYPKAITAEFGSDFPFNRGVDAAVAWTNGHAYFFRGTKYHKVRLDTKAGVPGYPQSVQGKWGATFFVPTQD